MCALYEDYQKQVQELTLKVLEVDSMPTWFPMNTRERLNDIISGMLGKPVHDILEAIYLGLRMFNGEQLESVMPDLVRIGITPETAVYLARVRIALAEGEGNGIPILIGAGATKALLRMYG